MSTKGCKVAVRLSPHSLKPTPKIINSPRSGETFLMVISDFPLENLASTNLADLQTHRSRKIMLSRAAIALSEITKRVNTHLSPYPSETAVFF